MIDQRSLLAEVRRVCEHHLDDLLADLVAAPSVNPPGDEASAAAVLARHLDLLGIDSYLQHFAPGRANLVAPASAWEHPPRLVLCSHLDVVPTGPVTAWSSPPFTLTQDGDRLTGRGVCDAKGPVAAMALAITVLERHLPGHTALAAVAGEEAGAAGSRALLGAGFLAAATVIGEPTGLRLARAHKGRLEAQITVQGAGGHAAMMPSGPTASERLPAVLNALQALARDLSQRPATIVGLPTLAVTTLRSADGNTATVPANIALTVDRRLVPGEQHETAARELEGTLTDLEGVNVVSRTGASPAELPADHALVRTSLLASPDGAQTVGFSATCDQYVWHEAGIPGVVLGPGDIVANRTHAADEHINRSELIVSAERFAAIALRWSDEAAA